MKKIFAIVAVAATSVAGLTGCGSSNSTNPPLPNTGCGSDPVTKEWTIFVYGHGDHNLTGTLLNDLSRMAQANIGGSMHFIVATDWNSSETPPPGGSYPVGTQWWNVTGNGTKTVLETRAEQNLDDPGNLTDAVTCVFKNYPARRYGVIMWDHGGAWDGGFGGDTQNGTVTLPAGMTIIQAHDAIANGLKAAGKTGPTPLDFLGFDTCLLGGAEEAYLMRDLSKVYIANAELDFGFGFNFADTFTQLGSNPNMSAAAFATMELASWETRHKTATTSDIYIRSHVAIDTSKVNAFATAMQNLVTSMRVKTGTALTYGKDIAYAAALSVPGYGVNGSQKTESVKYRDLGQFLKKLSAASLGDVSTNASTALSALSAMEYGVDFGSYRSVTSDPFQLGLNIALPDVGAITSAILADYATKAAAWTGATAWGGFLTDLLASKPTDSTGLTQTRTGNSATMTCTEGSNSRVTFGTLNIVRKDPDDATKFVSYGAAYTGVVTSAQANNMTWDGNIWNVGVSQQPAAVLPWIYLANAFGLTAAPASGNLLGAYGQVLELMNDKTTSTQNAVLLFKAGDTAATSIAYQTPSNLWEVSTIASYASEHTNPTFKPALIRWDDTSIGSTLVFGSTITAEALPKAGSFAVKAVAAPSDTYYFKTTCENSWGDITLVTDTAP